MVILISVIEHDMPHSAFQPLLRAVDDAAVITEHETADGRDGDDGGDEGHIDLLGTPFGHSCSSDFILNGCNIGCLPAHAGIESEKKNGRASCRERVCKTV